MQTLCLWKEKIKFPHIKKPMVTLIVTIGFFMSD